MGGVFNAVGDVFSDIGSAIGDVASAVGNVVEDVPGWVGSAADGISHVVEVAANHANQILPLVVTAVAPALGAPAWAAGALGGAASGALNGGTIGDIARGAAAGGLGSLAGSEVSNAVHGALADSVLDTSISGPTADAISNAAGHAAQAGLSTGIQTGNLGDALHAAATSGAGAFVQGELNNILPTSIGPGDFGKTVPGSLAAAGGQFTQGIVGGRGLHNSLIAGLGGGLGQLANANIADAIGGGWGTALGDIAGGLVQGGIDLSGFNRPTSPGQNPFDLNNGAAATGAVGGANNAPSSGATSAAPETRASGIAFTPIMSGNSALAAPGSGTPQGAIQSSEISSQDKPSHVWNQDSLREGLGI